MLKKSMLSGLFTLIAGSLFAQNPLPTLSWTTYTVKDNQQSAGFIDVHDLDGDGKEEIVLSTLIESGNAGSPWSAKGALRTFKMGTSLNSWTESVLIPTSANLPFINDPQFMDVDEDGVMDILVQQGFLQTNGGSHSWLKGPSFTQRKFFANETTKDSTWYFWHESYQYDLDGDGKKDIITTSAQTQDATHTNNNNIDPRKAKIEWYRHLGNGQFEYHLINDSLGGVFIKMFDVDGDGDKDVVTSQFFWGTSRDALVWLEMSERPSASNNWQGVWNYHPIDHTTGLGYYLTFYDIDRDGKQELVYCNHNNEDNSSIVDGNGQKILPGIYYFEIPSNPVSSVQWEKKTIYNGFRTSLFDFGNPASQGTPGIFSIGDLDNNGYPDLAVPGDGNDSLYVFRQKPDHSFVMEIIDRGKMFGMTKITDIDGDGTLEIVAAKHNFPDAIQILFPPPGYLKIYKPTYTCTFNASINSTPAGNQFCAGDTLTLTSTLGAYYIWDNNATTQSIRVTTSGTYGVNVTNSNGCSKRIEVLVNQLTLPTVVVSQVGNTLEAAASGAVLYQWYKDGNAINGALSSTYTPTETGNYTCMVVNSVGCEGVSNLVPVTVTGLANSVSALVSVAPVPFSDVLTIQLTKGNSKVDWFDIVGNNLKVPVEVQNNKLVFNTIQLNAGIYFISIRSSDYTESIRVVKK